MAQQVASSSSRKKAKPLPNIAAEALLPPSNITQEIGVLLPYQKAWIADKSSVKVVDKTRRCGLSFAEAADCALEAAKTNGMDCWYVGYNKDMAREFISDAAGWARFYDLAASEIEEGEEIFIDGEEKQSVVTFSIKFASGNRITALSSSPNNLRGKKGRVIIDEAAFHPNLDELIKSAMALTMWGGQVHIISTHNGVDNPFNQIIEEVRAGKKDYSLHHIPLENALADGLFRRICLVTKQRYSKEAEAAWDAAVRKHYGEHAAEELDCIPSKGGGKYLSVALIESCMSKDTPILRISRPPEFVYEKESARKKDIAQWCKEELLPLIKRTIPKNVRTFYGHDFARVVDLTVCVALYQTNDLTRHVPFVLEISSMPFAQQEQIIKFLIKHLPNFMGGALDAGGNGAQIAENVMQEFGATRIEQIKLSESWYLNHMPKLRSGFEDATLQGIPRHSDWIDDLRAIEVVRGIPKIVERSTSAENKKQKRHGDGAIALLMAYYASVELCNGKVRCASRGRNGRGNSTALNEARDLMHARFLRGYFV